MLRKHRDDEPEPPKDVDIERWFEALGEPPVAHEPPGARLRMLAQIEQHRKQSTFATPSLAMGLAAGLLLSLGLSLWWGNGFPGFNLQGTQRVAVSRTGLPTYRFQTHMRISKELQIQVAERLPTTAIAPVVGFTPQIQGATFFHIGRLHADVLAALHSRAIETADQYLNWLIQALTSVQAPSYLSQYLSAIQRQLQEHPSQIDQSRLALAGFESHYQEAYANTAPAARILFELGAWSENIYLAAATADTQAVKQGGTIQGVRQALQPLKLPSKSLELLAQLQELIDKPHLSTSDLAAIRSQVQALQGLLSH